MIQTRVTVRELIGIGMRGGSGRKTRASSLLRGRRKSLFWTSDGDQLRVAIFEVWFPGRKVGYCTRSRRSMWRRCRVIEDEQIRVRGMTVIFAGRTSGNSEDAHTNLVFCVLDSRSEN